LLTPCFATELKEALTILEQHGINRMAVVNKGTLVGLLTTEMIAGKISALMQTRKEALVKRLC
jgi:predicted transcriptional regulator